MWDLWAPTKSHFKVTMFLKVFQVPFNFLESSMCSCFASHATWCSAFPCNKKCPIILNKFPNKYSLYYWVPLFYTLILMVEFYLFFFLFCIMWELAEVYAKTCFKLGNIYFSLLQIKEYAFPISLEKLEFIFF